MTRLFRPRRGGRQSLFAAAQADPERFGDLFVEYHGAVLAFFARRVLDPETAYDLMAETFAQAFAGLDDLRATTEDQGLAWLWSIARHQLYRWRERGKVEQRNLRRLGIERPELSSVEFQRVEELADLDRARDDVSDALERLVPDQREAIRLRVIEERDYADIAMHLGTTEQNVRARVSRGLRSLAPLLAHLEPAEEGSVI